MIQQKLNSHKFINLSNNKWDKFNNFKCMICAFLITAKTNNISYIRKDDVLAWLEILSCEEYIIKSVLE